MLIKLFIVLIFLNLKIFRKSLIIKGVEIANKKKCHVHNGHADLKLLEIKKIQTVIIKILVKFLIFLKIKIEFQSNLYKIIMK